MASAACEQLEHVQQPSTTAADGKNNLSVIVFCTLAVVVLVLLCHAFLPVQMCSITACLPTGCSATVLGAVPTVCLKLVCKIAPL